MPIAANDNIHPDDPLRLDDAIKFGFPHGGMTVSGLRREAKAGRLVIEKIANKHFTTLRAIEEMRKLCRAKDNRPVSGYVPHEESEVQCGSLSTTEARSARAALLATTQALRERSKPTSEKSA